MLTSPTATHVLISIRSPEDFAILEAEYEHNPRPDKITRTGIVARVSMTDKEVQVSSLPDALGNALQLPTGQEAHGRP